MQPASPPAPLEGGVDSEARAPLRSGSLVCSTNRHLSGPSALAGAGGLLAYGLHPLGPVRALPGEWLTQWPARVTLGARARARSHAHRQMKISDVLRQLTEELRESHQRYEQEVNELLERADANLALCDELIEELDE